MVEGRGLSVRSRVLFDLTEGLLGLRAPSHPSSVTSLPGPSEMFPPHPHLGQGWGTAPPPCPPSSPACPAEVWPRVDSRDCLLCLSFGVGVGAPGDRYPSPWCPPRPTPWDLRCLLEAAGLTLCPALGTCQPQGSERPPLAAGWPWGGVLVCTCCPARPQPPLLGGTDSWALAWLGRWEGCWVPPGERSPHSVLGGIGATLP